MSQKIDFLDIYLRYQKLGPGPRAELRRVAEPADLAIRPAFYRLFPGQRPDERYLRVAFCLPWVKHRDEGPSLGVAFARPKPGSRVQSVHERRLFQVVRADSPTDLVQLRRLLQQVEPTVDWGHLGALLFYWNTRNKRRILEDYYLHSNQEALVIADNNG